MIHNYFWNPSRDTVSEIVSGFTRSFSQEDVKNILWNGFVCSAPLVVGIVTATAINVMAEGPIEKLENRSLREWVSWIVTAASFVVGAALSYQLAARLVLSPFSAEKTAKIVTVALISTAISTKKFPTLIFLKRVIFFCAGTAAAGYFGKRSLYVMGGFGALYAALYSSQVFQTYFPKSLHRR